MIKNTITLIHSESNYSANDVRCGRVSLDECLCDPTEVKRWGICDEDAARAELAKHKSSFSYKNGAVWVDAWALEFFESDDDGEFLEGSDMDLAAPEFDGDSLYVPALDGNTLCLIEAPAED